jgi:hypothetical protein
MTLTLNNVTIVNNMAVNGSGGVTQGSGTLLFKNTLIAGNISPSPDCSGTLTSQGYNLIQDLTNCVISGTTSGNVYSLDPLLGPLQDNGGFTLTHLPLPGSPVIDAGSPAILGSGDGACESTDQRGIVRPMNGDGLGDSLCDIGAVEADILFKLFVPLLRVMHLSAEGQ